MSVRTKTTKLERDVIVAEFDYGIAYRAVRKNKGGKLESVPVPHKGQARISVNKNKGKVSGSIRFPATSDTIKLTPLEMHNLARALDATIKEWQKRNRSAL